MSEIDKQITEELAAKKTSDNLENLKQDHALKSEGKDYFWKRSNPAPTSATRSTHVIYEKETGIPIANMLSIANTYDSGKTAIVKWHPDFLEMHPGLKNSYKYSDLDSKMVSFQRKSERHNYRMERKRKTSPTEISLAVHHILRDAHRSNYKDDLKVDHNIEKVSNENGENREVHHLKFSDAETGEPIVHLSYDNHKDKVVFNKNRFPEMTDDEMQQHSKTIGAALEQNSLYGTEKYQFSGHNAVNIHDTIHKIDKEARSSKTIATEIGNGVFKLNVHPDGAMQHFEKHLDNYKITKISPTHMIGEKANGGFIHVFHHDGLVHVSTTGANSIHGLPKIIKS